MNIPELYTLFKQFPLIDTDTRKIRQGSIFFALKGENFNGNIFAKEALEKGAAYAVVDEIEFSKEPNTVLVPNVLSTLQALATHHRETLGLPIIALTGSNGKTTTKELINAVLSEQYITQATVGNLNNHIGVPLTLLTMTDSTEIGIVEMGANHPKEIEQLCAIAKPNMGLITNFGKAHLEGFGSLQGVIEAKSELYSYLKSSEGTAFVNTDDNVQVARSIGIKKIEFNKKDIPFLNADPFVSISFRDVTIHSKLVGAYNYQNLAAAIAIGNHFKLSPNTIKNALEGYVASNNRSQIIEKKGITIILDAYNANPTSMSAALENFMKLDGEPKTAILGDMFELGKSSVDEHQNIAELAEKSGFDQLFLIGKAFSATRTKNAFQYDSFESFQQAEIKLAVKGLLLIKGSRGMSLERILDRF